MSLFPALVLLPLYLILIMVTVAQEANQITAAFVPDNSAPLIGQPFKLALVVKAPKEAIITLPDLSADFPPFMVKEVGEVVASIEGDQAVYQQILTVVLWRPGQYETPGLFVQYQFPETTEIFNLPVEKVAITVPSVLQEGDTDLRPLKPQIYLPYLSPWIIMAVIALALLIVFALRYLVKSRLLKLPASRALPAASQSPGMAAMQELRRIRGQELPPEKMFPQVADCLRLYLERRFDIPAPDMTTLELMLRLHTNSLLPDRRRRELQHLLERADLVKFARIQPEQHVSHRFVEVAYKWVETTENTLEKDEVVA